MSDQTSTPSKVASKFKELAEALDSDIEDVSVTIEDGSLSKTVISGADVAEHISEADDESEDTTEGDDQSTTETTEGEDESDDTTEGGHLKADGTKCQISEAVEDCHVHSSSTEETSTEGGDEDEPGHPEDVDNPSQENYVFHYGVCDSDDCSYGANGEEADFCASHQSSTDDKSSSKKTKAKDYEDLTEGEKELVKDLISDEGKDLEEAMKMV